MVAVSRNIVYSAFSLLLTFFGVAGLYVFLDADFLAAAQLLVYIGGILVLILFGIMLTNKIRDIHVSNDTTNPILGAVVAAGIFLVLAYVSLRCDWQVEDRPPAATAHEIGRAFMGRYLLPFEASSVLLLGALIGAAYLARRSEKKEGA
ncbi:MAG: NADH-quinone oxidoreductase subunit J [Candidatus Brocadiae bacterium]|nr:NADH-quinone oxidoreductase subunit J [Candidatus Brocadiia bacterium]